MAADGFVERWWWNAERFGFTPAKLVSRLSRPDGPRIVSNSLPKAGTHLLERALCKYPQIFRAPTRTLHRRTLTESAQLVTRVRGLQPNQVLVTHIEFSPDRAAVLADPAVRSLFLVRDPRDIVVSQAHFIATRRKHAHHALFSETPDISRRFQLLIAGSEQHDYPSLRDRLESYAGWLDSDSLVVRYEDLVGADGGGDSTRQLTALSEIFRHLGLEFASGELQALASATFSGNSPTFRRGTIGQWRSQFDSATLELFEQTTGNIAARYGYPSVERGQRRAEERNDER